MIELLIVDDSKSQQLILSKFLKKHNFCVHVAENGNEALEVIKNNHNIQMVISDWMMPEMDGIELCQAIRSYNFPHYIYFLLLTGKNEDDAVVEGMNMGADDFLKKPVNFRELNARLKAGFRVLELEFKLEEKNQEITKALDVMENDLKAAEKVLMNLLPPKTCQIHNCFLDWRFQPSKIIGGDMLGYSALTDDYICFYNIDVSGHGVPSALFSFSLHHILSDTNPKSSLLLKKKDGHSVQVRAPEKVMQALNKKFQTSSVNTTYFTMIYGILQKSTGQVSLVHAGHPSVLKLNNTGEVSIAPGKGAPVGMVPDFPYQSHSFVLKKGEALFCYTDGITECMNLEHALFGEERLKKILEKHEEVSSHVLMDKILHAVCSWSGKNSMEDDISYLLVKYNGVEKNVDMETL